MVASSEAGFSWERRIALSFVDGSELVIHPGKSHDTTFFIFSSLKNWNDKERTGGGVCKRETSHPCLLTSGDLKFSLRDTII